MIGSQEYKLQITVEGRDSASGPLGGVGSSLGRIGEIAGGILTSQLFLKIGEGILNLGKNAIQATADMQAMQVGVETLMAREISRGETQKQIVEQATSLSAQEKLKVIELGQTYDTLSAKLKDTQTQYDNVVGTQGANSEAALRLQVELQKLNGDLTSTNSQLANLKDKGDGSVLVLQSITTGAMTISDAMPQARIEAEKLLKQIRLLAIQSPFELSTVQNTFKMGMAFGFTAEESMAYTRGLLNTAAGVGASNEMLDRMAYNLAQVRMQGKVTAADVRQLAMAGFDLNGALIDIAKQSGYTITGYQDFNKLMAQGKLSWSDFASSFEKYADTQFGGASKRLSQTWNGLKSNFNDVFALSMPAIMGPALESVTGFLNGLMQKFIDFTNSGELERIGKQIGNFVSGVLTSFDGFKTLFRDLGNGNSLDASLMNAFDIQLPDGAVTAIETVKGLFDGLKESVSSALPDLSAGILNFQAFSTFNGDGIKNIVSENANNLLKIASNLISDLANRILPFLTEKFNDISRWFVSNGPLIQNFLQVLGVIFQAVWTAIAGVIKVLWDTIQPLLAFIIDGFLGLAKFFMQLFTGDIAGAFATLGEVVNGAVTAIRQAIYNLFNGILGLFGTSIPEIQAKWDAGWTGIKNKVSEIWNSIITGFKDGWNTIITDTGTWITNIITKIGESVSSFTEAGENLIGGLWDGIKQKFDDVIERVKDLASKLPQTVKKVLGIASPSKVFAEIGTNIMAGLSSGIGDGVTMPINAVETSAERLAQISPGLLAGGSTNSSITKANIYITIQDSGDPQKVVREIMNVLQANGIVRRGVFA